MKGCRCAAVLVLVLVAACASMPDRTLDTSRALASDGRWEDAISLLEAAAKDKDPSHPYRTALLDARAQAARSLLRDAEALAQSGRFDDARALYQRVLRIDPAELRASAGISSLQAAQRHAAWLDEAERAIRRNAIASAEPLVRQVLLESPRSARAAALLRQIEEQRPRAAAPALSASLRKPITLEFRDANLRMVFDVLSRASGINFVLDKDIRADARATIFIKNAPIEEALESLLVTNQLAKKTVGENSVLIYPNTPQKAREYQELVIRNFFLSNADAKQMMTLLRTILKTRDVYLDEKRNLLVIRDTPEAVLLAERLITAQEQAEPEVMLELEVIEVSRTRSSSLGVQFPEQVTFGVVNPITLQALRDLTRADVNLSTPAPPAGAGTAVQINLRRLFGDTNLLANPRIRVRNREKAKIHVGERVPIISSSIVATTAIQTQQVNYLDIGLKLEVEPQVMDSEVVLKATLEVSSLGETVTSAGSTVAYRVGTRNASTTLTLKDGETQVLAGLITDNDRQSARGVPGLADLPVLGRLFSTRTNEKEKSEIVLSITPRVVRRLERPEASLIEFGSGPETNLRSSVPPLPTPGSLGPGPAPGGGAGVPGAVFPKPGTVLQPGTALSQPGTAPGGAAKPPAPLGIPPAPGTPFIFKPPPGVGSP